MNLLAFDTSTHRATIALKVNGRLETLSQDGVSTHAKNILPLIDSLIKKCNISFNALDGIVFGAGPGSFTGLRVACSVAKGLAYACDLPLYPVSTLLAIAYCTQQTSNIALENILAVIDARMNEVYASLYDKNLTQLISEQVLPLKEIIEQCPHPLSISGVGFEDYLEDAAEKNNSTINSHVVYPDAASMIAIVEKGWVQAVNSEKALPTYIRNNVTQ